jgi:hypothetical protein
LRKKIKVEEDDNGGYFTAEIVQSEAESEALSMPESRYDSEEEDLAHHFDKDVTPVPEPKQQRAPQTYGYVYNAPE